MKKPFSFYRRFTFRSDERPTEFQRRLATHYFRRLVRLSRKHPTWMWETLTEKALGKRSRMDQV